MKRGYEMSNKRDLVAAEALFRVPPSLPPTAWWGHIPFLFSAFELLRPKLFVELGVHFGASFIAASQAAKTAKIDCRLVGVDTWQGDKHAGLYEGDEILQELSWKLDGNDYPYELMRMTFDEASKHFSDGEVDLLHIDGLHTYDAVKLDFDTWLPKMRSNGVVIFHDIHEFSRDFGVHKLWDELKKQYSTFEFTHSHGLGVLLVNPNDVRLDLFKNILNDENQKIFFNSVIENIAHGTVRAVTNPSDTNTILKNELDAIKSSRSWRYTALIRSLKSRFN